MTKPHPHQEHAKRTYYSFNYCTSIFIMHQSSSTTKRQRKSTSTNKSTFLKLLRQNYGKDENGKVIADKIRRFNS
jgi:hypothetical protein